MCLSGEGPGGSGRGSRELLRGPAEQTRVSPHARSAALPHPRPSRSSRSARERALRARCGNSPERRPVSLPRRSLRWGVPGGIPRPSVRARPLPQPCGCDPASQRPLRFAARSGGHAGTAAAAPGTKRGSASVHVCRCYTELRCSGQLCCVCVCVVCAVTWTCRHRDTRQNIDTHVHAQIDTRIRTYTRAYLACGRWPRCCCPAASAPGASASPSCCQ